MATPKHPNQRLLVAARKWRDFAEMRRDHYLDLYRSGRWSEFYTEAQFILLMRDVLDGADRWSNLAPRNGSTMPPAREPLSDFRPHRTKARS